MSKSVSDQTVKIQSDLEKNKKALSENQQPSGPALLFSKANQASPGDAGLLKKNSKQHLSQASAIRKVRAFCMARHEFCLHLEKLHSSGTDEDIIEFYASESDKASGALPKIDEAYRKDGSDYWSYFTKKYKESLTIIDGGNPDSILIACYTNYLVHNQQWKSNKNDSMARELEEKLIDHEYWWTLGEFLKPYTSSFFLQNIELYASLKPDNSMNMNINACYMNRLNTYKESCKIIRDLANDVGFLFPENNLDSILSEFSKLSKLWDNTSSELDKNGKEKSEATQSKTGTPEHFKNVLDCFTKFDFILENYELIKKTMLELKTTLSHLSQQMRDQGKLNKQPEDFKKLAQDNIKQATEKLKEQHENAQRGTVKFEIIITKPHPEHLIEKLSDSHKFIFNQLFSDPVPNHEMLYKEIENLLSALGGKISNIGTSNQPIKMIHLNDILGFFITNAEIMEERIPDAKNNADTAVTAAVPITTVSATTTTTTIVTTTAMSKTKPSASAAGTAGILVKPQQKTNNPGTLSRFAVEQIREIFERAGFRAKPSTCNTSENHKKPQLPSCKHS